jgi:hypothetical protein
MIENEKFDCIDTLAAWLGGLSAKLKWTALLIGPREASAPG